MKYELMRAQMNEGRPVASAPGPAPLNILDIARTLWNGKIWILLAALAIGSVGWGYATRIAVPRYTALATVALENRQESVIDLQNVVSGLSGDQATINTEVEVLRSRDLFGRLVDKMSLVSDPEFNPYLTPTAPPVSSSRARNATINRVLETISIANLRSSYVFTITATTTDPQKSAALANTLGQIYIEDQRRVKADAMAAATAWLTERVATLKTELQAAEAEVKTFAAQTDLVSTDALESLTRQIKDTRQHIDDLEEKRAEVRNGLVRIEAASRAGDLETIAEILQDATLRRLSRSRGDPQSATAYDARFVALRQVEQGDIAKIGTQIAALQTSLKTLEASYARQSADLVQLEQLEREAQALRAIYEHFLARLQETSVQQGIQQPDSRMLSHAAQPNFPSSPHAGRVTVLAALLGAALGAGLVLLRELRHTGFRTAEEIEQDTGVTVMGQIPRLAIRRRRKVVEYFARKPTSAAAEAVRNLRTSLLLASLDRAPQVILCTSSLPSEGKTTTALSLAQNFAGLGKSVLLIEGDIRRRVFSEYFDFGHSKGLLSVLSGSATFDEVVQRVELLGADVLLGEKSTTNAADVLSSDRFSNFMADIRTRYDVIIVDTPPVLLVPDSRIVAHTADAVLFTIKWDATSRAQVHEAVRQFAMAGISITGAVLNQIDPKGMKRYGYGESYGVYAAYGDKRYYAN